METLSTSLARFKICLVTWPHCHVIVRWHCHCGCLDTKWLSRDKQFKWTFYQVNYWWKTLGGWQYESRNSFPQRYKFKKSRDKNKTHTRSVYSSTASYTIALGFCDYRIRIRIRTRTPSKITKAETLRPLDSGLLLDDFCGGSGWTEFLTRWFLLLSNVSQSKLDVWARRTIVSYGIG